MPKVMLCEARGPLNDLNEKLAGEAGDEWLGALKCFLRRENPWIGGDTTMWPLRVMLGQYKSQQEICALLEKNRIPTKAVMLEAMLGHMDLVRASAAREVELTVVTSEELGITARCSYRQLMDEVIKHGYAVCPQECGPLARLQYNGDESMLVVTQPISTFDGGFIFMLDYYGGPRLDHYRVYLDESHFCKYISKKLIVVKKVNY
jgi:hypothetical protein